MPDQDDDGGFAGPFESQMMTLQPPSLQDGIAAGPGSAADHRCANGVAAEPASHAPAANVQANASHCGSDWHPNNAALECGSAPAESLLPESAVSTGAAGGTFIPDSILPDSATAWGDFAADATPSMTLAKLPGTGTAQVCVGEHGEHGEQGSNPAHSDVQQRVADPNIVVPETCAVPCTLPDSLAAEPSFVAAAAAAPAAPHSPSLQNADWPEAATNAEPGDAGQHVRLVGQVALQAEVCASPPLWPQGSQGEQQIPETPDDSQPLQDMHENVAEAAALQPTSCAAWPAPCAPCPAAQQIRAAMAMASQLHVFRPWQASAAMPMHGLLDRAIQQNSCKVAVWV